MATPDNGTSRSKADPKEMAETMADAPALRPKGRPTPQAKPEVRADAAPIRPIAADASDSAMDETAADVEVDEAGESGEAAADEDVDLNRIYDRPEVAAAADAASLYRFDPEAGRTSVAVKVKVVTQALRNSVSTPFGKLVVVLPVLLLGISLTIAAINLRDMPWIVAAGLVMPVSLALVYWRYQVWLGHKRYMYRLLETLGEDVSDFDPHKIYRKAGSRAVKRRR